MTADDQAKSILEQVEALRADVAGLLDRQGKIEARMARNECGQAAMLAQLSRIGFKERSGG